MGKLTKNRTAAIISPSVQNPLWGGILYFASFTVRPVVACFIIPYIYIYMHTYTSETHPFTVHELKSQFVPIEKSKLIPYDPYMETPSCCLKSRTWDLPAEWFWSPICTSEAKKPWSPYGLLGTCEEKRQKWKNIWTWMIQKRCLTMNYFIKYDVLPPKLNSWPIWL